jgi:hypothetical protein
MALISFFIFLPIPALLIAFIVLAIREENNNMNNKQNAKYAFYYLLSLVALIFTALSVGMVVFSIIDKTIPDALNNYGGSVDGTLKFAISALFIAAPIFYFISSLINKGLRRNELDKESGIRRWLTYFILLVSSLIILGVFIGVINNFLSGELTSRFALKALTVFILSALPFAFYFYDIKRTDPEQPDKVVKIFFFATLTLVLAAFIAAWFFVESPSLARAKRLDQSLVSNIYSLESAVNNYYDKNEKLPDSLDVLVSDRSINLDSKLTMDVDTKAPITYHKLNDKEFEFCATFRTDSLADRTDRPYYPSSEGGSKEHAAGYQCLLGNLYSAVKAQPIQ